MMQKFVNIRVDGGNAPGSEIAKQLGIDGYPTLVVVDGEGHEVDRIVGYRAPDEFTKEIGRILSGEGTLPSLRKAADADPENLSAAFALATKLVGSNAPDAFSRLDAIAEKAKGKDREIEAGVLVAFAQRDLQASRLEDAAAKFERVALGFADTKAAKDATYMALALRSRGNGADPDVALAFAARLREASKDGKLDAGTEQTIAGLHLAAAEKAMARAALAAGDDAMKLNAIAWTCYERRIAIVAATEWARTAVAKSERDVQILDTLACLLSVQKKFDEALAIEIEAIGKLKESDDAMRKSFERNVATWVMERDAMRADRPAPSAKPPARSPKPKAGATK